MDGEPPVHRHKVDLLFRNQAKWNNPRRKPLCRSLGVGSEASTSFHLTGGEVHQDGLGHVIEVVSEGHHVRLHHVRKGVDPLASEDTAV